MAGVFSRFVPKCKFFFLHRRFSSRTVVKTETSSDPDEICKVSTLFVPSKYAAAMYQIVKPLIDINYISDNLGNLKLSCDHRGIQIDLDYVLEVAKEWLNIKKSYSVIIEKDKEYVSKIHHNHSIGFTDKLKTLEDERNKNLEILLAEKAKFHNIEDIIMPLFQKIPHILHPSTPLQFDVIHMCKELPTLNGVIKSHTEIAQYISFMDHFNYPSISYFMTGKLAELDICIQMYFVDKLNACGFFPLSCVDFCKSFIIEAIGYDPYSSFNSIQIKEKENRKIRQKLHIVGGASFESFCAYLTNMNTVSSTLPVKYFSLGRRYNAANKNSNSKDLFSVVQSTNVHGLILSVGDGMNSFDILLQMIIDCYSELNIPFRIVNIAAKNLTVAESHRKQVELWSPALKEYIPVAYVSQHDDFVSKRLQITYGISKNIKEGYCNIVEGTVVNIPILIGCIIENYQEKDTFNVPTVLEKYMPLLK